MYRNYIIEGGQVVLGLVIVPVLLDYGSYQEDRLSRV